MIFESLKELHEHAVKQKAKPEQAKESSKPARKVAKPKPKK